VVAVADGDAALSAAGTLQPQVAILDIGLPGMDGYDLARVRVLLAEAPQERHRSVDLLQRRLTPEFGRCVRRGRQRPWPTGRGQPATC